MNNDEHSGEGELRERILRVIRSSEQGPNKSIPAEELQKLKAAAGRLDQILKDAGEADTQVLKNAAARLDQLLEDLKAGKDVVSVRKRRRD